MRSTGMNRDTGYLGITSSGDLSVCVVLALLACVFTRPFHVEASSLGGKGLGLT